MTRVSLLFPPGWTSATGSAHLGLPTLKSWLEAHGNNVVCRDLNWESTKLLGVAVNSVQSRLACLRQSMHEMNNVYFDAEDDLERVATNFAARWNAQLGFEYIDSPQNSSKRALDAVSRATPFHSLFDEVVREIEVKAPDIVGFCLASTYQIVPTLQLCRRLKDAGYQGFIVLGGNTISRLVDEMIGTKIFDLVDGLITFQGEMPLLRLCQAIENGTPLDNVPQLIWRDSKGVHWNKHDEPFDPDASLSPDYQNLPVGQYWGENYLNLVGSRGCYYGKCNFCDIPYGWGAGGYAGQRSVEQVCDDVVHLIARHGITRFKFVDEALSPSFMRAFAKRILADRIQIEWEGYTRLERIWNDPEFISLIAKAGFRKGYFGLEILPSSNRNALNKRDSADPSLLLKLCQENDVKVHFFCMFGYPGTNEDDAVRTVDFLLSNHRRIDTADIFPWTHAKHTSVPGVYPIKSTENDWALEFEHTCEDRSIMSMAQISELAGHCEEILWEEAPRLLHPVYRLVSPWFESIVEREYSNPEMSLSIA